MKFNGTPPDLKKDDQLIVKDIIKNGDIVRFARISEQEVEMHKASPNEKPAYRVEKSKESGDIIFTEIV